MRSKSVVSMLALAVLPGLAACQVSSGDSASGGDYPGDTIEIIVGTSAGGPTDTNTRVLATCMEKDLGQTIVVKNVDGASGAMGNRELISAKADGYTLSLTPATGLVLSPYLDDLGFSHEDVTPIGRLFATTMVFVTKDSYKNGEEFFADAKKNPGKITVGTPGPTSPKSVVMEALRDNHDIDLKPVPLDGDAGVVTAMLGNNIDVAAVEATETLKAYIASGELTALATSARGPCRGSRACPPWRTWATRTRCCRTTSTRYTAPRASPTMSSRPSSVDEGLCRELGGRGDHRRGLHHQAVPGRGGDRHVAGRVLRNL